LRGGFQQGEVLKAVSVGFEIGNLGGGYLGASYLAAGRVVIDDNAAGYGWFVDPTPMQDEEFHTSEAQNAWTARENSDAHERIDLLTVVLHEMGHFAGLADHDDLLSGSDLMTLTLGTSTRRVETLDALFGRSQDRG
jgi:hypothetical protein